MASQGRQMCRGLLRLAREHDKKPHLSCLIPDSLLDNTRTSNTSAAEDPLSPPSVSDAVRNAYRNQSSHDPRKVGWILHYNLNRHALWSNDRHQTSSSNRPWAPHHPNLAWFQRQLAELQVQPMSLEDLAESGTPSELDILRSMQEAGCRPTSEILLQALKQVACRHGGFQHTLEAFWHWELYGSVSGHISEHREDVARALVKSALLDYYQPASASSTSSSSFPSSAPSDEWRRPLRVWRSFLFPDTCLAGPCITNQLLHRVASLALHSRCGEELTSLVRELKAAAQEATSRGIQPTGSVYQAMARAFNRAGDMQAAFECSVGLVSAGGSIPASLSVDLLEWAADEGDKDMATFLEEEIVASGKAQYLAALNSPTC